MRRREWLLTMGGAAAALCPGQEQIPAHPSGLQYPTLSFEPPTPNEYRHVLDSGAIAYLVEDHELPLISLSLTLRVGGYQVPEENTGLASFTGSQMRAGGTVSTSARDFDENAAFLATNLSSNISGTSGGASVNCLTQNLDASLAMLFDMLKNPGFDAERLELACTQSKQRLPRRNDRLGRILSREFSRLMRGKHFTTRHLTDSTLQTITPDLMRQFHQDYYTPQGMILAVSGDFDTADIIKRLNASLADGWPANTKTPGEIPVPGNQPVPGVYMVNKTSRDINQSHVAIGHLGIQRSNPDAHRVSVMNSILGGGGFTSRIMTRVRSDEGLAYSAFSRFRSGTYYPGVFQAGFQSRNATCAQAASIILEEIKRIQNEQVTANELDTAKNYLIEVFPRFFATAGQVAGTFASDEFTKREKDYWQKFRQRIADVSIQDVMNTAQTYLKPDKLVILAVGDQEAILRGNPDNPEYKFESLDPDGKIQPIPLPDPVTMEYPEG